jgi:hypothetical protein
MIEIEITRHLTKAERLVQLSQAIEEAEKHGFADVNVKIHNHQIVDINLNKCIRFGNCTPEWYGLLHDSEK